MKVFALIIVDTDIPLEPIVAIFASKQGAYEASRESFESYDTEDAESDFDDNNSWVIEYGDGDRTVAGSIEDLEIQ